MAGYDLAVIGSGPGGYVCAIRAAQLGLKVAIGRDTADASIAVLFDASTQQLTLAGRFSEFQPDALSAVVPAPTLPSCHARLRAAAMIAEGVVLSPSPDPVVACTTIGHGF